MYHNFNQFINFSEKPISEKVQICDTSKNLIAFVDLLPRQAFSFEPQYIRQRIFLQLQNVSALNKTQIRWEKFL